MNPVTNNLLRVLCVGLLSLGGLTSAPVAWAIDPCCSITSINTNGRVTARELAGKRVFQFQVTDQAVLQSLRVGQQIHADFTAMKVSVRPDGISPCCAIVQAAEPKITPPPVKAGKDAPLAGTKPDAAKIPAVKLPTARGADPCCAITSIAQNGQVTARQTSSKRVFQFQVNDKALLATLRPGQQIHADFGGVLLSDFFLTKLFLAL